MTLNKKKKFRRNLRIFVSSLLFVSLLFLSLYFLFFDNDVLVLVGLFFGYFTLIFAGKFLVRLYGKDREDIPDRLNSLL